MSANPKGIKMPRSERAAQVRRLKEAGLTFKEITAYLGVARSTVTGAYYDPTGEGDRERKTRVHGHCVDCGTETYNSGSANVPKRCQPCQRKREKTIEVRLSNRYRSKKTWSDEDIFAAIRSVARLDGRATVSDYKHQRDENPTAMPSLALVLKRFGRWADAVNAAGCIGQRNRDYDGSITPAGCWLALEDCAAEVGRPPTYSEYCEWAERTGSPCGSTIRNKVGSWTEITRRLIASQEPELAVAA